MYTHPLGRAYKAPMGIHSDDMIEGLASLVKAVHEARQHVQLLPGDVDEYVKKSQV